MMRVLKIVLGGAIGLILVGVIILTVFLTTFDINTYRSRITQELSAALSREVQIEQLRLNFKFNKGLTISVKGLSIADDPSFSQGKVISADLVYLNTDILALMFRRQIVIAKIDISGPRVYLVRNKEGLVNIQTLFSKRTGGNGVGETSHVKFPPALESGSAPARANGVKSDIVIPQMLVHAVRVENGAVTFVDESFETALTVPLQQIDLQATQLSLEKPFPFEIKAKLWADQQNIVAAGQVALDIKNNQVDLQRVRLETDLSQLRLRAMPFYNVLKEQLSLEGDIDGKLFLRDMTMRINQDGLAAFSLGGELNGGRLSSGFLRQPLSDIHARFHADQSNIALSELTVAHASGTLSGQGRWSDYGKSNMFMFDLHIDGVQLGELIPRANMPVLSGNGEPLGVEGGIYAVFDVEGHGARISELRETLQGDGSVEIRGGKLLNINLLRFILDKLSFIPDLVQKIEVNLPQRYKDGLQSEETLLGRVASTIKLKDQALVFNAELQADGFAIIANGNLNLDQDLVLTADFFIPEDLGSSMITSVPELSYLSDTQGRIHIPFKPYQGELQAVRLYPDVEELGKKVIQNRGKEELKRAIFRALDIEESPGPAQQPAEGSPAQDEGTPQEEAHPEKILIEGIFDAIFKGNEVP